MDAGGPFLLVDDEPAVTRDWARQLRRYGQRSLFAHDVDEARHIVAGADALAGVIVDYRFPSGTGLDVIAALRARHGFVPAVMVTGMALDDSTIARVHGAGCMVMPKLSGTAWFAMFVEQARLAALARCDRRPSIDALLQSRDLTAREREIFWLDMRGDSRAETAAKLGITRDTLQRHIRAVIRKCGPCKNMRWVYGSLLLRFCSPRVDH